MAVTVRSFLVGYVPVCFGKAVKAGYVRFGYGRFGSGRVRRSWCVSVGSRKVRLGKAVEVCSG